MPCLARPFPCAALLTATAPRHLEQEAKALYNGLRGRLAQLGERRVRNAGWLSRPVGMPSTTPAMFAVYVLQSRQTGRYYIGQTSNLEKRLARHRLGRTQFARRRGPWELVYVEYYPTRAEAMRRERQIKGWKSHRYVQELVAQAQVRP